MNGEVRDALGREGEGGMLWWGRERGGGMLCEESSCTNIKHHCCSYFHALSCNEVPPVKERLDQPLPSLDERLGGLTKGVLSILHKQASTLLS